MTSTKQPKPEQNGPQQLNEAALERAAGGGDGLLFVPLSKPMRLASSDGAAKAGSLDLNDLY